MDLQLTQVLVAHTTQEQPQINFARMIGYYTRDFRTANVVAATDYLVLICLDADLPGELGRSQAAVCHEALRELVLETREFAQLLGDIYADGTRSDGAIERRERLIRINDHQEYLREVTLQAATVASNNGRATDAVLLYHLAEDYNNVLYVINRAMSDTLTVAPDTEPAPLEPLRPRDVGKDRPQGSQRDAPGSSLSMAGVDDPFKLASHFTNLYFQNAAYAEKISKAERELATFLSDMYRVRESFRTGSWQEVLQVGLFSPFQSTVLLPR